LSLLFNHEKTQKALTAIAFSAAFARNTGFYCYPTQSQKRKKKMTTLLSISPLLKNWPASN